MGLALHLCAQMYHIAYLCTASPLPILETPLDAKAPHLVHYNIQPWYKWALTCSPQIDAGRCWQRRLLARSGHC